MNNHAPQLCARQWLDKLLEEGPVRNIEGLTHCPLGAGYFFKFCQSEYCSETINFIIEVDKYIELYATDDGGWDPEKTWKDLDIELSDIEQGTTSALPGTSASIKQPDITELLNDENFISPTTWPSGKVDRKAAMDAVRNIWRRFLADTAPEQICLPATVMQRTYRRLYHVDKYGKELFQEACRDREILSTQRDIAMRFQKSDVYAMYMKRLEELTKPSCNVTIHIPGPRLTLTGTYTKNQLLQAETEVLFTLEELQGDGFLYGEFMRFLSKSLASEHLRFVRAVYIFKKVLASPDPTIQKKASDWAFKVYQNFIVPGSPFEISCPVSLRREAARCIAVPHAEMFKPAEKESLIILRQMFDTYKTTPEYAQLRIRIVENFDAMRAASPAPGSFSGHTVNSKLSAAARIMAMPRQNSGSSVHSLQSQNRLPPLSHAHSPVLSRTGSHQTLSRVTSLLAVAPGVACAPGSGERPAGGPAACGALSHTLLTPTFSRSGAGPPLFESPASGASLGAGAPSSRPPSRPASRVASRPNTGHGPSTEPTSPKHQSSAPLPPTGLVSGVVSPISNTPTNPDASGVVAAAALGPGVGAGAGAGTVSTITPQQSGMATGTTVAPIAEDLHSEHDHSERSTAAGRKGSGLASGLGFLHLPAIKWFGAVSQRS